MSPLAEYQSRAVERRALAERELKLFRRIGNARLAVGIAGVIMAFFVFGETVIPPELLGIPFILFLILIIIHSKTVDRLERATRAAAFYERGIARLESRWMGHGEQGDRFRNPGHVYEEDLDIFGKGSLFELLCTARTRSGENTLAQWLLSPATREEVAARQEAVAELRERLDLREELAVLGDAVRSEMDPDAVASWAESEPVVFPLGARFIAPILAAAVVITFALYMSGISKRTPFLAGLLVELSYAFLLGTKTLRVSSAVNSPARDLALFAKLLERLERERFSAPLLEALRARLAASGLVASVKISHLRSLVARMDWQRNIFFAPIAMATLWGAQVAMAIERWRKISGPHVREWIATAGEFEALFALAGYSFEHPSDPFPELAPVDGGWFDAAGLGHPLMDETHCVRNDLKLGGELRLLIVSGSNMSGKSTLLRAVGLNSVLAWAGAPVRATRLSISPLRLGASIRVLDSLQDGRSRFYTEITRLREIVGMSGQSIPALFLMDELLSGTNSHDRRIGASAIVRTLVDRGAIGIITTHDLALAHIADDLRGRAINVHFADTLENSRLHFDYRLQPGVVERSNALDLMRSVGLDV
ncbi:MAG TPA: hypothetical protein VGV35_04765 [Bryobacteraceae bacterium]|nr:hypothetical protein [Bryobacteraceae bacterium]